jgi:hypothetical protein
LFSATIDPTGCELLAAIVLLLCLKNQTTPPTTITTSISPPSAPNTEARGARVRTSGTVSLAGRGVTPAKGTSGAGATIVFMGVAAFGAGGDAGLAGFGKTTGLAIVSGGSAAKLDTVWGTMGSVAAVVCGTLGSTFSICVGGGAGSRTASGDLPRRGSKGADRIEPSIKQKVIVSSKVRLHVGQLFIIFEEEIFFQKDKEWLQFEPTLSRLFE